MLKNKINIGIIGAGNMAYKYLEVLTNQKSFNVHCIHSRTIKKSNNLAKKFNIFKVYKKLNLMLKDISLDAVLITVSYENIYKITKIVLNKKIPVFIEKPVGLSSKEAKILMQTADKYKIKNMVGLNRRFYSNFIKGKKIISKYGGINNVIIEGHERFWNIQKNNNNRKLEKWIYINGIHTIDLIRYFGGDISKINILKKKNILKKGNQFLAQFAYKNPKITGTYFANWFSPGGWSVKLYGNGITVIFQPLEKGFYILKNMKKVKINLDKNDIIYKPGLYKQMQVFKNYIIKNSKPKDIPTLNDVYKTYEIIDKFYK
tara:strand:- start:4060 stop:5010 length:951 start_codon:yes stop_codon:yes gene_type:complete